jgi:hypothetical protein
VATQFSRLLRHAWVTVRLFLFPSHHTGNIFHTHINELIKLLFCLDINFNSMFKRNTYTDHMVRYTQRLTRLLLYIHLNIQCFGKQTTHGNCLTVFKHDSREGTINTGTQLTSGSGGTQGPQRAEGGIKTAEAKERERETERGRDLFG